LNVSNEKSLDNRIVAVDKFAPLITEAFTVDTLHVLILAFGLIKLFAKTEVGVSISPPNWAKFDSVHNIRGHCPLTRLQDSLFVPPLRKYILLSFICTIPDLPFVSFKYKVGLLLLIMILSVDVILSLVKVSIFPLMTSMVEKLPVFMFAKFVTVNKPETKIVVVKPSSSND